LSDFEENEPPPTQRPTPKIRKDLSGFFAVVVEQQTETHAVEENDDEEFDEKDIYEPYPNVNLCC
jgi:hypothetical protein